MRGSQVEIIPGLRTEIWGIPCGPRIHAKRGVRPPSARSTRCRPRTPLSTTSLEVGALAGLGFAAAVRRLRQRHHPPATVQGLLVANDQDARTLRYHHHGLHHRSHNAYMGLAAMYILHDSLELSLPIPHGADDVPLIFRDGAFTSTGALFLSAKPPTLPTTQMVHREQQPGVTCANLAHLAGQAPMCPHSRSAGRGAATAACRCRGCPSWTSGALG
jgi:hypothetical protein